MKDSELTEKQAAELVRRLASDDAFRTLFENKPAKALFDMGVPAETIVELNAKCLCPTSLASKEVFQTASTQMDEAAIQSAMAMNPPKLKL